MKPARRFPLDFRGLLLLGVALLFLLLEVLNALPGVLTPTGIGTDIEKGKQKLTIEGKEYLLELPLGAEFALIKAEVCDKQGNCFLPMATKNAAVVMAMSADYVIVEAEAIVEAGALDPDKVTIPGVFISAIVKSVLPAANLQLKA